MLVVVKQLPTKDPDTIASLCVHLLWRKAKACIQAENDVWDLHNYPPHAAVFRLICPALPECALHHRRSRLTRPKPKFGEFRFICYTLHTDILYMMKSMFWKLVWKYLQNIRSLYKSQKSDREVQTFWATLKSKMFSRNTFHIHQTIASSHSLIPI